MSPNTSGEKRNRFLALAGLLMVAPAWSCQQREFRQDDVGTSVHEMHPNARIAAHFLRGIDDIGDQPRTLVELDDRHHIGNLALEPRMIDTAIDDEAVH